MTETERSPRVVFDLEQAGPSIRTDTAPDSVQFFLANQHRFKQFVEAWAFDCGDEDPLAKGFFREAADHRQDAPPAAATPSLVLIDRFGDQLWISGLKLREPSGQRIALAVLDEAGFEIDHHCLARHYVDRRAVPGEADWADRTPFQLAGETAVYARRSVKLLRVDSDQTGRDVLRWWNTARGPNSWLGTAEHLALYGSSAISRARHYYGFHLVALGSTGRQAWIQFPEPVIDTAPRRRRRAIRDGYWWVDEAIEQIFGSVGKVLQLRDQRRALARLVPPEPRPSVIYWP